MRARGCVYALPCSARWVGACQNAHVRADVIVYCPYGCQWGVGVSQVLAVRTRHVERVAADAVLWTGGGVGGGAAAAGPGPALLSPVVEGAAPSVCFACVKPLSGLIAAAACGSCGENWHLSCAHHAGPVEGDWACPRCLAGAATTVTAVSQSQGGSGGGGGAKERCAVMFNDLGVADPPALRQAVVFGRHPATMGSKLERTCNWDVRDTAGVVGTSEMMHPACMRAAYVEYLVLWRETSTVHATWVVWELLSQNETSKKVEVFLVRARV